MWKPSASSAIEPVIQPATISPAIISAVSTTTQRVRQALSSCAAARKT